MSTAIRYAIIWQDTTDSSRPCDGTITITPDTLDQDAPPSSTGSSIPCMARLVWAGWRADFCTSYDAATDSLGIFIVYWMNRLMREQCHESAPDLVVVRESDEASVAVDDDGKEMLMLDADTGYSGCSPTSVQLYAKRWREGEEVPGFSSREKRLLGIEEDEDGDEDKDEEEGEEA